MKDDIKMGPHLRSKQTTTKMMKHLAIALLPIVLFAWYKNGILPYFAGRATFYGMIYPILLIVLSTSFSYLLEVLYALFILKEKHIFRVVKNSYAIFPGLFLALILPYNTPISILLFGAFCATVLGKLLFGGFGHNIFNPALIGRLLVITAYALVIGAEGGYLNPSELDAVTHATPLTNGAMTTGIGTYETIVAPYGSLWNFFFGMIPGAMGETSKFLCLIAFVYLTVTKTIKWRIPVCYIGTVFMITWVIGGLSGLSIWYPLYQILSGGLFFGAIFMATDPVTSPVTPWGQGFYGVSLGILTVLLRYLTPYPEGVLTSILALNLFVILFDRLGSTSRFKKNRIWIFMVILTVVTGGIVFGIHQSFQTNDKKDANFEIIGREKSGNIVSYIVSQVGYSSKLKANIVIQKGIITKFELLTCDDSFCSQITNSNYVETLKKEQNNLTKVDAVSGATITSNALKKMLENTLKDYKSGDQEEVAPPEVVPDPDFSILAVTPLEEGSVYQVSQKSFGGKMILNITTINHVITHVEITEYHDTYYHQVMESGYLNQLLVSQNQLESVDAVSGATITSNAIKNAMMMVLEEDRREK